MRRDRWSAAGLALLAIGYLLAARRYPLDTLATPGPGVVPLLTGAALLGVAVWLFATARVSLGSPARRRGLTDVATTAPPMLAAALVLYAALLPRLGFVVSSFALVVAASRLMGAPGWWRPAALALGVTAVGYLLFARWLGVPLP